MTTSPPAWFVSGDRLRGEVCPTALSALKSLETANAMHESLVPEAALFHLSDCIAASMQANGSGQHSVAISLLRGCVEALTDLRARLRGVTPEEIGVWIKQNTDRHNILLEASCGRDALARLEKIALARLKPVFEGRMK